MRWSLKGWAEWLRSGPNRIALSTALRGTVASATPLALLPHLGLGALAYPSVLGALATSLVDVGGPYRSRLAGMLIQALAGPCLLLLGSWAVEHWWLAALLMFAIAGISGLLRVAGPTGAPLGINTAVAFLVGLQVGEIGGDEFAWAAGYAGGGLWTVLVALGFWQLRPYRRLEQEVASAWEAAAALVAAAASEKSRGGVVARRRREQRIAARHAAAREAIERARDALGAMRAGTAGPGITMAQLVVLLTAAARIAAAAVTLGEVAAPADPARRAAEAELLRSCRAVARILLGARETLSLAGLRHRIQDLRASRGDPGHAADLLALAQALRHLDNAAEALRLLFGERPRAGNLLRLPLASRGPRGAVIEALWAHLTPSSAIFRHAVRVASITAIDTAIVVYFHLPRGIWLTLTSLVILQPDYGGTVTRALERTAGTIAGAMLAGALIAAVHGTAAYDAAIGLLLFATFLVIRRSHGWGVTFLTPLIILLISMGSADPWTELVERIAYTIAGAVLALAAGYLLWPQWEGEQLPDRLARATRADTAYLGAVLSAFAAATAPAASLAALRREAEIAVSNADAGFQRMLAEPARQRAPVGASFQLLVYLHRLCRHGIALSAQLGVVALPAEPLGRLRAMMEGALEDAARALLGKRDPAPRPGFDEPLALLSASLSGQGENGPAAAAALLLSQLVSDATGLWSAAGAFARSGRPVAARQPAPG